MSEDLNEYGAVKTGCYADPSFITNAGIVHGKQDQELYIEKYSTLLASIGCSLEVRTEAIDIHGNRIPGTIALHIGEIGPFKTVEDAYDAMRRAEFN